MSAVLARTQDDWVNDFAAWRERRREEQSAVRREELSFLAREIRAAADDHGQEAARRRP